jgi:hypothetical protein
MTPTIEGNKLIAEFMGYHYKDGFIYADNPESAKLKKDCKYHTSWDWIMPCWEKLRLSVWENCGGYPKEFMVYVENYKTACFNNSIGDARLAVMDGIQFLNQQNPKQ